MSTSSKGSWNVVAGYVMSEAARRNAESALRRLKVAAGFAQGEEVKLKNLSEAQILAFFDDLAGLEAIAFASCIDLGAQGDAEVGEHQANQVASIRANLPRMMYEEGRRAVEDVANRVERLPTQLYIQMVVQIDLLDQIYRASTLYFSQRVPATLSTFRWRIDEKNRARPVFEETLRHIAPPLLQSRSLRDPAIFVNEFDYSHYERSFSFAPGEMPTYLREETGIDIKHGSNLGKVLRDFEFVRSHDVLGVQIADILSSSFRRLLRNDFKINTAIAKSIGRLTLQRPYLQPSIHLISLMRDQFSGGQVASVVRTIASTARAMIR